MTSRLYDRGAIAKGAASGIGLGTEAAVAI
jgi:hypothetical protein